VEEGLYKSAKVRLSPWEKRKKRRQRKKITFTIRERPFYHFFSKVRAMFSLGRVFVNWCSLEDSFLHVH
jgi:hypothetical protein